MEASVLIVFMLRAEEGRVGLAVSGGRVGGSQERPAPSRQPLLEKIRIPSGPVSSDPLWTRLLCVCSHRLLFQNILITCKGSPGPFSSQPSTPSFLEPSHLARLRCCPRETFTPLPSAAPGTPMLLSVSVTLKVLGTSWGGITQAEALVCLASLAEPGGPCPSLAPVRG